VKPNPLQLIPRKRMKAKRKAVVMIKNNLQKVTDTLFQVRRMKLLLKKAKKKKRESLFLGKKTKVHQYQRKLRLPIEHQSLVVIKKIKIKKLINLVPVLKKKNQLQVIKRKQQYLLQAMIRNHQKRKMKAQLLQKPNLKINLLIITKL